jgi:Flp pilus assembly secretin CpaC
MLRTLGSLTLLCIACSVVSAAEARRATREDRGEQPRNGSKPVVDAGAARMVMIEVLIADLRHGEVAKGDAGDLSGDPKARIQQLDKAGKLDSLTRVQLTTVDGQKASLHVGQRIARIIGSQRSFGGGGGGFGGPGGGGGGGGGQVNSFTMENVGLLVGVTPHIRHDGLVFMAINIERSQLGPAEEGPVISKPSDGEAIRAVPLETLTTETTISCRSGQSVIVGVQQTKRQARQSELLIIVTPELLGNEPPPAAR